MAKTLKDCLGKAKGIGILTDAEMQFVLKRAAELGNEKQAITEIHAQRLKEYEAIKTPNAADRTVIQTANENVALAAYMEEVRNATTTGIQPGRQAYEAGRKAGEAAITATGTPPAAETIAEASIQTKDGRVFAGKIHSFAIEAAQKAGALPADVLDSPVALFKSGFTTSTGRFVDAKEAFQIAKASKQGNIDLDSAIDSAEEHGGAPELDATDITAAPAPVSQPNADADIESVRSFLVSPQQQGHTVRPSTEQQMQTALDMGTKLIALHGVSNVKMEDTFGMYQGSHNRQFVTTFKARHDANLTALVQEAAKEAGRTGQDSITISRVLEPGEDNPNARPGIDVEFKNPIPVERIDDIVRFLRERGIDGFDLIPSGYDVATGNPRTFKGLRFEEKPEFSHQPRSRKDDVLVDLAEELMKMDEVANVTHQLYDSVVLTSQDYDKNGILAKSGGGVRAAAWSDRAFLSANPQAARERSEAFAAEQAKVAGSEAGDAEALTKELETAAALVAAGKAASPVAAFVYQDIYRRVVSLMQQNRAALEGKKFTATSPEALRSEALLRALGELDALLKYVPAEVRGKVGGFFQLAKVGVGEQALAKFFGDRIRTLERELSAFLKKQYRKEIDALLDKSKAKTTGGIKKSRIGADAQDVVDRARIYSKLSSEEVARQYTEIENALASGFMPDGTEIDSDMEGLLSLKQHELSVFGDMDHMTAGELYAAYRSLEQTIKDGRSAWGAIEEARLAEKQRKVAEFLGKLPVATSPEIAAQNDKALRNFLGQYIANHYTASQLIGKIAPGLSFTEDWHNETRRADGADIDLSIDITNRMQLTLRAALGKNSALAVGRALEAMDERNVPSPGGMITQLEAMQYLFTWNQEVGKERMTKQGWLPEHIAALENATSSPVAQALSKFILAEYQRMYLLADPVVVRHYGMHLPNTQNYAPMYHHPIGVEKESSPLAGVFAISGLTPGALKGRVNHNAPVKAVSALDVFNQYVSEMGHWIAFADVMRDMRGVINDRAVKMALEKHMGTDGARDLSTHLDTLARKGIARGAETSAERSLIQFILSGTAKGALAFNPRTVLVQFEAGLRWMFAVPLRRWIPTLLNRTWMTNLPTAWNSPTIQRRIIEGMNPLMQQTMQAHNLSPGILLQMGRVGYVPMKYMDAYGTTMTAAIVYTDALSQGMTHEEAMDVMDDAVARYAQPIGITSKSRIEAQGTLLSKFMFLFMSDMRLKSALTWEAIDDLAHARNVEKAIGTMITVEVMGIMTQMIANVYAHAIDGDDGDDDDWWLFNNIGPVMLTAPFAGLWGLGTVISATVSKIFGEKTFPKEDPILSAWHRGERVFTNFHVLLEEGQWNDQKFIRELDDIAKTLGMIPALSPLAMIMNVARPAAGVTRQLEE